MYEPENARKWRLRADDLRARAEKTQNPALRQSVEHLAQNLDRMADAAERALWTDHTPAILPLA